MHIGQFIWRDLNVRYRLSIDILDHEQQRGPINDDESIWTREFDFSPVERWGEI